MCQWFVEFGWQYLGGFWWLVARVSEPGVLWRVWIWDSPSDVTWWMGVQWPDFVAVACGDCALPLMLQLSGWKEQRWKWGRWNVWVSWLVRHCPAKIPGVGVRVVTSPIVWFAAHKSARPVAVHQPESARKTVTLLACVTDQQTMTSSLSDILENVKTARENALLGSYDTSQVYYQGALQQIQKHLSTVADPTRKQKWQQVRSASGIWVKV